MVYDVVIVGAGLAGLRCGIALQSKGKKTCILEKYGYTGGRVVTYHNKEEEYHWENGAGRIASSHTKVHSLLDKYGLTAIPIGSEQNFIPGGGTESDMVENTFEIQLVSYLQQIKNLSPEILANHTLEQIFKSILGESKANQFLDQFAYRAEVTVMRADLAIESFLPGGEMGTYEGYTVCKEGLSAMIDGMVKHYESLGGEIFLRHEMIGISEHGTVEVRCKIGSKKEGFSEGVVEGKQCILALHSSALKACKDTRHFPVLQHLVMCPLLRTYGVFSTRKKKSWFSGLPRVVTGNPVRYFIPIDPTHGVAMVSYTDADDASRMIRILEDKGEAGLGKFILKELRSMFPDREIPDYIFFKAHPWYQGCTYWTPGDYNVKKMSKDCMHPDPQGLPSVYLCGESFSTRQAWMEGALEHADQLLQRYF
jgi:monoamine oxidase